MYLFPVVNKPPTRWGSKQQNSTLLQAKPQMKAPKESRRGYFMLLLAVGGGLHSLADGHTAVNSASTDTSMSCPHP